MLQPLRPSERHTPGRTMNIEKTVEAFYNQWLRKFEGVLGHRATTNAELDQMGQLHFGEKYVAALPAEHFPRLSSKRPYAILNNKRLRDPAGGEHWLGLCWTPRGTLVYDSYGREPTRLIEATLPRERLLSTDPDVEQGDEEDNCGPRCLAWLTVCEKHGWEAGLLV